MRACLPRRSRRRQVRTQTGTPLPYLASAFPLTDDDRCGREAIGSAASLSSSSSSSFSNREIEDEDEDAVGRPVPNPLAANARPPSFLNLLYRPPAYLPLICCNPARDGPSRSLVVRTRRPGLRFRSTSTGDEYGLRLCASIGRASLPASHAPGSAPFPASSGHAAGCQVIRANASYFLTLFQFWLRFLTPQSGIPRDTAFPGFATNADPSQRRREPK